MSTYSTYYTIMSMIDGFKSFINLAVMVLTIVASWIMYAKAGEHGWAAIVPFYSSYVKFRIAGKQKLFWGYLVASIASIAGCILLMYEIIASGLSVMTSSYMGSYYDSTYGYAGNRIGAHMGHADICGYSDYCSNDCGIGYEYPLLCRTGTCVWQGSRICLRTYIPQCDFYLYYCLQQKHCLCGRWIQ